MEIDQDNFLWIGTMDGLIYYDIENRELVNMFLRSRGVEPSGKFHLSLAGGCQNRVWVGSEGKGVTLIDGGEFVPLDLGFEFTPTCFAEDREG